MPKWISICNEINGKKVKMKYSNFLTVLLVETSNHLTQSGGNNKLVSYYKHKSTAHQNQTPTHLRLQSADKTYSTIFSLLIPITGLVR